VETPVQGKSGVAGWFGCQMKPSRAIFDRLVQMA